MTLKVNLHGGGFTGQSQALRLAIARALVKINADDKKALRAEGFMTRDPRQVERKKPGRPKDTPPLPVQQALIVLSASLLKFKQRLASKLVRPFATFGW